MKKVSLINMILPYVLEEQIPSEVRSLDAEGRKVMVGQQLNARGVVIPLTALGSAEGRSGIASTHLLPEVVPGFIPGLLKKNILMEMGAGYLPLNNPSKVKLVRSGGVTAEWLAENEALETDGTPTVDSVSCSPKRICAEIKISKQLFLQADNPLMAAFIESEIQAAINEKLIEAAVNGLGESEPLGIVNHAAITVIPGGTDGAAPTRANLLKLEKAVSLENVSDSSIGFLTNPGVREVLRSTENGSAGSGLYVWPANNLFGYPAVVSNAVPANLEKGDGTSLSAIIAGDWSKLLFVSFGAVEIVPDLYTFAKDGIVSLVVNSLWDVAVLKEEAFAVMNDVIVPAE